MLISFILYSDESIRRVIDRTKQYIANRSDIMFIDNVAWLDNWYIEFSERMVSINVFDVRSNWMNKLREYIDCVFIDEKVFVSSKSSVSKYFTSFNCTSSFESIFYKSR